MFLGGVWNLGFLPSAATLIRMSKMLDKTCWLEGLETLREDEDENPLFQYELQEGSHVHCTKKRLRE